MSPSAPHSPGFPSFLIVFAAMWVAIMALLSRMGGWSELAERFPARDQPIDETYRMTSMSLGRGWFPVSYSNCLSLRVGAEGFGVGLWMPFRPFHPDLFIPWRAVRTCEPERFMFMSCTAVYLSNLDTRMLFRGRAGRALQSQWARFAAAGM